MSTIDVPIAPLDPEIENRLCEMMEKNSPMLLNYFLGVAGKLMVEANAANFDLSHDATHNGKRYNVSAKFKIKQIKTNAQ